MKNYYTQSVARVTNLQNNRFFIARVKLSLYYTLIFTIGLSLFSILPILSLRAYITSPGVKKAIVLEQERAGYFLYNQDPADGFIYVPTELHPRVGRVAITEEIERDVQGRIFVVDMFLIVLSFCASFFLAKKTLAPLEYAMKKQESFARDASHELRTPLAIIKNECEIVLRSKVQTVSSLQSALKSIIEEVDTMTLLTTHLLESSRRHFLQQNNQSTNLSDSIRIVTQKLSHLAQENSVTFSIHIDDGLWVRAGSESVIRIYTNLIANAITYNIEGGTVTITAYSDGEKVISTIADTGTGIEKKYLEKIGTPFFKVDKSRASRGTGLGISIVKALMEELGGSFSIASKKGIGTTVTLVLRKK